jgi:8-amino-7-oxononanoate synthase
MGFDMSRVVAPIFPVVLGDEATALEASRRLRARGFFVRAIRPPTVPPGTSRLRVSITAAHREEHVDGFIEALAEVLGPPPAIRHAPERAGGVELDRSCLDASKAARTGLWRPKTSLRDGLRRTLEA